MKRAILGSLLLFGCGQAEPPDRSVGGEGITFEQRFVTSNELCFTDDFVPEEDEVRIVGCSSSVEVRLVAEDGVITDGSWVKVYGGRGLHVFGLPFLLSTQVVHRDVYGRLAWFDADARDDFSGSITPIENWDDDPENNLSLKVELTGSTGVDHLEAVVSIEFNDVAWSQLFADGDIDAFFAGPESE